MDLKIGAKCVLMSDAWNALEHYRIKTIQADVIELNKFLDSLGTDSILDIQKTEFENIFVSPYSMKASELYPGAYTCAVIIDDLSSALLGVKQRIPILDLINELKKDRRLRKVPERFIEGCLRSCVAAGKFSVFSDGRRNEPRYELELSDDRKQRERNRVFAGTFADELQSLSERIRNLIQHTGSVGTYRENLLQTLLQKHLPERYHVATGFIHGCPRQLDVLIYDRIDYAPLFREGDLVVVPSESVRAVIEVKTNLTKDELCKSLRLLNEVAYFDDLKPPFFRGIFGFESSIKADQIFNAIADFYAAPMPDEIEVIEDFDDLPNPINEPFRHVSSVCVLGHAYSEVAYLLDEDDQYNPTLIKATSAAGFNAQAAYFLQHLLAHLRFGGLKSAATLHIEQFLGADTRWEKHSQLTGMDGWSWGAYFGRDHMDAVDEAVQEMEQHIGDVKDWLGGMPWDSSQMGENGT